MNHSLAPPLAVCVLPVHSSYCTSTCAARSLCSPRDSRYTLFVIIDDFTRYLWGKAISHKSDAFAAFRYYRAHAESQHSSAGHTIRSLRSDNGGEFISTAFSAFLDQHGIRRQLTAPYTPQHNSVVERRNRTIVGDICTALSASGLPISLWAEAASTSMYIRNRLPTTSVVR